MDRRYYTKKKLSAIGGFALSVILVITIFTSIPPEQTGNVLVVKPGEAEAISIAGFDIAMMTQQFLICNVLNTSGDDTQRGTVNYNISFQFTDTDGNAGTVVSIKAIFKDASGNDQSLLLAKDVPLQGGFLTTILDGPFSIFSTFGGGGGFTFTVADSLDGISGSDDVLIEINLGSGNKVLYVLRNTQCNR